MRILLEVDCFFSPPSSVWPLFSFFCCFFIFIMPSTVFQTVFCFIFLHLLYFLFKCVSGPTLGNIFISKKFHTVPRKVFLCSNKQNSEQPILVSFYLFSMVALRWNNLLVSFFFLAKQQKTTTPELSRKKKKKQSQKKAPKKLPSSFFFVFARNKKKGEQRK